MSKQLKVIIAERDLLRAEREELANMLARACHVEEMRAHHRAGWYHDARDLLAKIDRVSLGAADMRPQPLKENEG